VKVPAEVRKCVGFVAYDGPQGRCLAGTAFFVGEELADKVDFVWLVTAAHVINGVIAKSVDQKAYIRLNKVSGGMVWLLTDCSQWILHGTADVAVMAYAPSHELVDYMVSPLGPGGPATDEIIGREGIGVGDEVFLAGLFVNHAGLNQNIPIVRVGNIAAMPGEPIHLKQWGDMAAYLVEARSIGGLSGSPVFAHLGVVRYRPAPGDDPRDPGELVYSTNPHGNFYLLGIMHGHYDGQLTEVDEVADEVDRERVNMGIAVVVPVQRLLELVARSDLLALKEASRQHLLEDVARKAASAPSTS
jgi:hypothetical protein